MNKTKQSIKNMVDISDDDSNYSESDSSDGGENTKGKLRQNSEDLISLEDS